MPAAALVLLNRHWRLGLTLGELSRIGATLGSDIPFFLAGPTAVVSGRGERVELLPPPPLGWVVLVHPRQPLSTAAVYGALRPDSYSDGRRTRQLAAALRQGCAPDWATTLTNGLAATAARLCPTIGAIRNRLHDAGACHVQVSGSGPTVFALCASETVARRIAAAVGSGREYTVWGSAVPLGGPMGCWVGVTPPAPSLRCREEECAGPLLWWNGTCAGWYDSRWRARGLATHIPQQTARLGCRASLCTAGQELLPLGPLQYIARQSCADGVRFSATHGAGRLL